MASNKKIIYIISIFIIQCLVSYFISIYVYKSYFSNEYSKIQKEQWDVEEIKLDFSTVNSMNELKANLTDKLDDKSDLDNNKALTKFLYEPNGNVLVFTVVNGVLIDPWGDPYLVYFDKKRNEIIVRSRNMGVPNTIPLL